jgi:hypothetical protein
MPFLTYAAVLGTTAYIAGTVVTPYAYVAYSYLSFNGAATVCSLYQGDGYSNVFVPVAATFNLATLNLTPPFSVQ